MICLYKFIQNIARKLFILLQQIKRMNLHYIHLNLLFFSLSHVDQLGTVQA
jgi:hypothetical protein